MIFLIESSTSNSYNSDTYFFMKFSRFIVVGMIASVINLLLGFFLVKVHTFFLTKASYAYLILILSFVNLISTTCSGAFDSSVRRYYHEFISMKEINQGLVFTSSILSELFMLIFFFILSIIYSVTGYQVLPIDNYVNSFFLMGPLAFSIILYLLTNAVLITEQNLLKSPIHVITLAFLKLILSFFGLIIIKSFFIVIIVYTISHIIPTFFFLPNILKKDKMRLLPKNELIRVLKYGIPIVIRNFLKQSSSFLMIIIILILLGPEPAAIVGLGLNIAISLDVLLGFIFQSYEPFVISCYKAKSLDKTFYPRMFTQYFLVGILFLSFWLNSISAIFIVIISNIDYLDALLYLPFALGSILIIRFGKLVSVGIIVKERTEFEIVILFIGLLTFIGSMLILIPQFGLIAIGISELIYGVMILSLNWISGRYLYSLKIKT
ncbi:MAG: lipopolysaccharide biosynthesis protein, partial [Candidatus Hodarchaeota archaeon]